MLLSRHDIRTREILLQIFEFFLKCGNVELLMMQQQCRDPTQVSKTLIHYFPGTAIEACCPYPPAFHSDGYEIGVRKQRFLTAAAVLTKATRLIALPPLHFGASQHRTLGDDARL